MGLASGQGRRGEVETEEELMDRVDAFIPEMFELSVTIDGVPVAGLEDGNLHYLAFTGVYPLILGSDRLPWWHAGDVVSYYSHEIALILTPLPPGEHVIEMKGKTYKSQPTPWSTEVTYHLTVVPGRP